MQVTALQKLLGRFLRPAPKASCRIEEPYRFHCGTPAIWVRDAALDDELGRMVNDANYRPSDTTFYASTEARAVVKRWLSDYRRSRIRGW